MHHNEAVRAASENLRFKQPTSCYDLGKLPEKRAAATFNLFLLSGEEKEVSDEVRKPKRLGRKKVERAERGLSAMGRTSNLPRS